MKAILKKLHAISQDVGYIQKDAKNPHHGYTYASERAIKEALHAAMNKHGVIMQIETADVRVLDGFEPTRQGKEQKATVIDCVYRFFDVDTGEKMEGKFVACGPARDDKGLWAATTNAIKYVLTTTFLIPTGDDAESSTNHPAPNHPETTDSSTDAKAATVKPKAAFVKRWRASCKTHGIQPPATKTAWTACVVLLCNQSGLQEICVRTGADMPIPTMADDSNGWAVLAELAGLLVDEQVRAIMVAAMLAKAPQKESV